jgi:outer membrane protein TolC
MNIRRQMPTLLALATLLSLPGLRAQQAKPAALTLEDCVIQAVKRNLGVAVQVYSYRQADVAVSQAGEKFYPSLSFDYNKQNQNSASFS